MKIAELGKEIKNIQKSGTVAIITDSNVAPLYLEITEKSIRDAGFDTASFVVPAGEMSKCGAVYLDLLEKLAGVPLTRSDGVVALGGGVVGDLAGFVAATYLRGVKLYQVPTTLLAMVDSSIGGKTGIDLNAGKNIAGAFYLPNLIFRDSEFLNTLQEKVFREGCAEVIKYGVILDENLFDELKTRVINKNEDCSDIIERCVKLKTELVASDLRDNGARQLLNFGHTIGHAVEKLSDYSVSHGDAVAKGMLRIAEISEEAGWCQGDVVRIIREILEKYGFDLDLPYSADDIFSAIESDKKRRGNEIDLIIPKEIGRCKIERIDINALKEMLKN